MRQMIVPYIHNRMENAEHRPKTRRFERALFLGDYRLDAQDASVAAMMGDGKVKIPNRE